LPELLKIGHSKFNFSLKRIRRLHSLLRAADFERLADQEQHDQVFGTRGAMLHFMPSENQTKVPGPNAAAKALPRTDRVPTPLWIRRNSIGLNDRFFVLRPGRARV
jgi:hypothetical protein